MGLVNQDDCTPKHLLRVARPDKTYSDQIFRVIFKLVRKKFNIFVYLGDSMHDG
jgi:hypothetical protein